MRCYHYCLMGVRDVQALKSILGVGVFPIILFTFLYSSGVIFSNNSKLRRYSFSCSTFLGPITTESRYSYPMVHARHKWISLKSIPSANSLKARSASLFLGVLMGSKKNQRYLANCGKLYLAVFSAPSRYLPVRYPPARGLQAIRPYLYSLNNCRQSTSASSRWRILQQFWAPMGRCSFSFSQIASASMTCSADQLEVAQQKAFPSSIAS